VRTTDTVVIGAGQAGLAASRCLTDRGRDHVVLERGRIGQRWRGETWDSLHLLTPNWMNTCRVRSPRSRSRRVLVRCQVHQAVELVRRLVRRTGGGEHRRTFGAQAGPALRPDAAQLPRPGHAPGLKMVGDITYIETWEGWV